MSKEPKFSGGPLPPGDGWAKIPFCGSRAHYWAERRDFAVIRNGQRVRFWASKCGVDGITSDNVPMLGAGNFPFCKRCMRACNK